MKRIKWKKCLNWCLVIISCFAVLEILSRILIRENFVLFSFLNGGTLVSILGCITAFVNLKKACADGKTNDSSKNVLNESGSVSLTESERNALFETLERNVTKLFNSEKGTALKLTSTHFVEPAYGINGMASVEGDPDLTEKVLSAFSYNPIAVVGNGGVGKSYALRHLYRGYIESLRSGPIVKLPLFVDLKTISEDENSEDFIDILTNTLLDELPNADPNLRNKIKTMKPLLFADALDEYEQKKTADFKKISGCFRTNCIITMREESFRKNNAFFSDNNFVKVTVFGWRENELKKYIENSVLAYNERHPNAKIEKDDVNGRLKKTLLESSFFVADSIKRTPYFSPLLAALAVYTYIDRLQSDTPEKLTVSELIKEAIKKAIKREVTKKYSGVPFAYEYLMRFYIEIAGYLYTQGNSTASALSVVAEKMRAVFPQFTLGTPSALKESLKEFFVFTGENDERIYPIHQFILSYLMAEKIILWLETGDFRKASLFSSDVNRILGELYEKLEDNKKFTYFSELQKAYYSEMGENVTEEEETKRRTSLCYFLGRFPFREKKYIEEAESFFQGILDNEKRNAPVAITYNIMTLRGKMDKEEDYFKRLKNDAAFRTAHLISYLYYQKDPLLPETEEKPVCSWGKTARYFAENFNSGEDRHRFIRRIDLFTVLSFLRLSEPLGVNYADFCAFFLGLSAKKLKETTITENYVKTVRKYGKDEKVLFKDMKKLLREIKVLIRQKRKETD